METGAIHAKLVYICFIVMTVKSWRALVLVLPQQPIPKVEAALFKEFKWLRARYLGNVSFVFSKCSTNLRIYERKCFSEHPSDEKRREMCSTSLWGCLCFIVLCNIFPISLHCTEMKPQRPYDHKFSGIKEEGGLQCGINVALTLKSSCLTRRPWT